MISRRKVNQLLFLSIIILAVVAGWAVSELFKENTSEVSNDIDLKLLTQNNNNAEIKNPSEMIEVKLSTTFYGRP